MERLEYKRDKFIKALDALSRSINFFLVQQKDIDAIGKEIFVASIIKHFELCYEMAWKFLKQLLEAQYKVKIDSPKKVFRECFALNIIDEKTTRELLAISEARNATTHDYDEETAKEILARIGEYNLMFEMLREISIH